MEQNHMLTRPSPLAQDEKRGRHMVWPGQSGSAPLHFANSAAPNANLTMQNLPQYQAQLQTSADDIFLRKQKTPSLSPNPSAVSRSLSPPSHSQPHEPAPLSFPDVPTTELAPIQSHSKDSSVANNSLPSLSSITGAQPQRLAPLSQPAPSSYSPPSASANHWPSLNPLTAYYSPSHAQAADSPLRMEVDAEHHATRGHVPEQRDPYYDRRAASVSLDDPNVRMAAEALGDLRADFVSSPSQRQTPTPSSPEPLLSLLTTSHPLLATTIGGAASAYNHSKNFSPRLKTGAEYVEGYLGPLASAVGNVGRKTGVEGGVRWFLGARRRHPSSSDLEAGNDGSNKRRKFDVSEKALEAMADESLFTPQQQHGRGIERRTSTSTIDTLPAYDDHKSPAYTETAEVQSQLSSRPSSSASLQWRQRIVLSTSGLGIAMREESLRSLKYCLRVLRLANAHLEKIVSALKSAIEQYDGTIERRGDQEDHVMTDAPTMHPQAPRDRNQLTAWINSLRAEISKTLHAVINKVSTYAGGALPENAKELVYRHLASFPERFRVASMMDVPAQTRGEVDQENAVHEGVRVLVLAKEGLEMLTQVSGILDSTITSAEEWCETLGKTKRAEDEPPAGNSEAMQPPRSAGCEEDIKMSY
ncbi:clock-controlled protein 8 [Diplogelasinospora grovesii]|uniref:Clock-controlled protein 8 n=1 Tax=Diplogelasinospora grovesii TaxID=303347 RepID=A0AAN6N427_9PEZI|nr:clock-controlled protein 8 [Diplogelasinospora grovesii]